MDKLLALVIEDDPQQGEVFALALENDFSVELLTDGTTGLSRLEETIPNLVVLDYNLPDISGREILKKIRRDTRLSKTKIIVAAGDPNHRGLAEDDADVALLKPISPMELLGIALRVVSKR